MIILTLGETTHKQLDLDFVAGDIWGVTSGGRP